MHESIYESGLIAEAAFVIDQRVVQARISVAS